MFSTADKIRVQNAREKHCTEVSCVARVSGRKTNVMCVDDHPRPGRVSKWQRSLSKEFSRSKSKDGFVEEDRMLGNFEIKCGCILASTKTARTTAEQIWKLPKILLRSKVPTE